MAVWCLVNSHSLTSDPFPCFRVEMGEGGERREETGRIVMPGLAMRGGTGFRIVLGAICVGAVVGLSLAVALPATQAAEQVSDHSVQGGMSCLCQPLYKANDSLLVSVTKKVYC